RRVGRRCGRRGGARRNYGEACDNENSPREFRCAVHRDFPLPASTEFAKNALALADRFAPVKSMVMEATVMRALTAEPSNVLEKTTSVGAPLIGKLMVKLNLSALR